MAKRNYLEDLGKRNIHPDDLAEMVKKNLDLLPEIFEGVSSQNKRIKNGTAKILRTLSEEYPEKLYPRFDFFVEHMNGDDTILKWLAIDTIANMAGVDNKNKIDKILKKYYEFLSDESMITAGHAVESLAKIAYAKPEYQDEITSQLFRVKTIRRNSECRNILLGKVILGFEGYIDQIEDQDEVISFVKRELKNSRKATKKKAEKFLKRLER
jgi:hypothetical protein